MEGMKSFFFISFLEEKIFFCVDLNIKVKIDKGQRIIKKGI